MSTATNLLRLHLRGLAERLGARSIAAYVPAVLQPEARPLLLHHGPDEPGAEVATPAAAGATLAALPPGQGLRVLHARQPGHCIVALTGDWCVEPPVSGGRRSSDEWATGRLDCPPVLIGLVFEPDPSTTPGEAVRLRPGWVEAVTAAAAMAVQVQQGRELSSDRLTGLPGTEELFSRLSRSLRLADPGGRPFALVFLNPDDFVSVNDRFGREAGDRALREIAERLRTVCRGSDFLARYGSAIFACLLPDTPAEAAREVAERTRGKLAEQALLDGAVRLSFSAGVATCAAADPSPTAGEMVRRAHQALSLAKRSGGGTTGAWHQGICDEEARTLDRMSGIFTGSLAKDYRNIGLLWDAVSAMGMAADFPAMAGRFVEGLMTALRPLRVAIVDRTEADAWELVYGLERHDGAAEARRVATGRLGSAQTEMLASCHAERRVIRDRLSAENGGTGLRLACCVPLLAGQHFLGALYLDGPIGSFEPDGSDIMFLEGLAAPLAVARDRALLFERERRRGDEERQRLAAELESLRRSLQEARLLHRSDALAQVLATARRAAATDATVLVTGESGTGKELLARTLHEMSPRRKGPFVVVDCGALPATLVESELFGHERGAFTGADARRPGRLAEAEHGTVVLDEIAELPLDVQGKLLRFVQERQVTPVGGRPRLVDARLIAATHRDLRTEVATGRFREDLFHRLNVVHLELPPLRERPDDILHLAEHYLERYALLYGRPVRRLSAEAESAALRYSWPGNVRELQNRILQAIVLGEGAEIAVRELLGGASVPRASPSAPGLPASGSELRLWEELRQCLAPIIEQSLSGGIPLDPPLGERLEDELIMAAHRLAGGVLRRAAVLTGLPDATFRRRYDRALQAQPPERILLELGWTSLPGLFAQLLATPPPPAVNRLDQIDEILYSLVDAQQGVSLAVRSALIGVTPTTYRRRGLERTKSAH